MGRAADSQLVILLHGEPGAGKDATGKFLVEQHGFTRFAFADRLKEMCEALNPIVSVDDGFVYPLRLTTVIEDLGWDEAKKIYPEVRRTQQRLATEVIREFVSPSYWADYVYNAVRAIAPYRAVITDLRFQSEMDVFDRWNLAVDPHVWWIERPYNPQRMEGENATHVSEAWHPSEYTPIRNNHDLPWLETVVKDEMWKLAGPCRLMTLDRGCNRVAGHSGLTHYDEASGIEWTGGWPEGRMM